MFVFDLDGTLIDSFPALKAAMAQTLNPWRITLPEDCALRLSLSDGLEAMFDRAKPAHMEPNTWGSLRADWFALYQRQHLQETPLFPGVRSALQQLHEAGQTLAICTNRDRDTTLKLLQLHGLQTIFSHVVALEDMALPKPAPDGLQQLCTQAGLTSMQDLIFIGDSEVDAQAALNAKVRFCAHLNGYHRDPLNLSYSELSFDDYSVWTAWTFEGLQATHSATSHGSARI